MNFDLSVEYLANLVAHYKVGGYSVHLNDPSPTSYGNHHQLIANLR